MQSVAPIQLRGAGGLESKYPNICICESWASHSVYAGSLKKKKDPAIYPYSEIYPACTVEEDILQPSSGMLVESDNFLTYYPNLVICMNVTIDDSANTDDLCRSRRVPSRISFGRRGHENEGVESGGYTLCTNPSKRWSNNCLRAAARFVVKLPTPHHM